MARTSKSKTLRATCVACGCKSRAVEPTSPAAPMLTVLEQLGKDGWTYAVDFFSMATGQYREVCPACTAEARAYAAARKAAGGAL